MNDSTHDDGAFGSLVRELSRLPGLGPRSARRVALHLLTEKSGHLLRLSHTLEDAAARLRVCDTCGNLDDTDPCRLCVNPVRDTHTLCVVASVADVWAMERTHAFKGRYHVLGGVLSAIDGITPETLSIEKLLTRLSATPVSELVLALAATVDGQSTAHYLTDRIARDLPASAQPGKITRLALGIPMGGELDYLDDGTIAAALKARAAI